jgi:hypothetical protein
MGSLGEGAGAMAVVSADVAGGAIDPCRLGDPGHPSLLPLFGDLSLGRMADKAVAPGFLVERIKLAKHPGGEGTGVEGAAPGRILEGMALGAGSGGKVRQHLDAGQGGRRWPLEGNRTHPVAKVEQGVKILLRRAGYR